MEKRKEGTFPSFQPVQFERIHAKPLPNIIEGTGKVYWSEKGQRTPIPASIRHKVWDRANGHCEYNGGPHEGRLQIHHINGDPSDHSLDNLILLCEKHHRLQTNKQRPYWQKPGGFGIWKEF